MNRNELLESIANTIHDYRKGELEFDIDENHVDRWVSQFEKNSQLIILQEMNSILKKYYFCKKDVKEIIKELLEQTSIFGNNLLEAFSCMNFLDIQAHGKSQKELLSIVKKQLMKLYKINIDECGGGNTYFYIDDCLYTGNQYRHDIVDWIKRTQFPPNSRLITFDLALHRSGWEYANKWIMKEADNKSIKVDAYRFIDIINKKNSYTYDLDVLWPLNGILNDKNVSNYYEKIKLLCSENGWSYSNVYRYSAIQNDGLFSSSEARNIVESEFLMKGSKLVMAANDPAKSMRPLGYEKLETLGFGTFFVTYRNIANNCPLVLWYGDPDNYQYPHPFNMWYPLLPRKVNEENYSIFF